MQIRPTSWFTLVARHMLADLGIEFAYRVGVAGFNCFLALAMQLVDRRRETFSVANLGDLLVRFFNLLADSFRVLRHHIRVVGHLTALLHQLVALGTKRGQLLAHQTALGTVFQRALKMPRCDVCLATSATLHHCLRIDVDCGTQEVRRSCDTFVERAGHAVQATGLVVHLRVAQPVHKVRADARSVQRRPRLAVHLRPDGARGVVVARLGFQAHLVAR